MKKLSLLFLISLIFLFSGCTPNYNIEPKFNENKKTLTINNTVFQDSSIDSKITNGTSFRGDIRSKIINYKLYNQECKRIQYRNLKVGDKTYMAVSEKDRIFDYYDKGTCYVTTISNLNFLSCQNTIFSEIFFYITSDVRNQYGYDRTKMLELNGDCYKKIKKDTLSIAHKDGVKIYKIARKKGILTPLYE